VARAPIGGAGAQAIGCAADRVREMQCIWRMKKSPGHRKWPDHRVQEQRLDRRVQVEVNGQLVADSTDVIMVQEDENPVRYYFPRRDVKMGLLERSDTKTECPFKGEARYFTLQAGGEQHHDVVWSYEDPYEEHRDLEDRVAFYEEKLPKFAIRTAA
jgi:uncharacterized protein (DUF427 family)